MIDFTKKIKAKGYSIEECRKMWNYQTATWYRHVNNEKYRGRIECLINGLPSKQLNGE